MAFLDETGLQHFYKILDRKIMCAKNDAVSNMATALKPMRVGWCRGDSTKIDLTMGGKLDVSHTIYNFQVVIGNNEEVGNYVMYNFMMNGKSFAEMHRDAEYYVSGYPSDSDGYCNVEISRDSNYTYYARLSKIFNGKTDVGATSDLFAYAYQLDGLNRLPSYYEDYIRSRIATIKNLDNSVNGFSFVFVTDTHGQNRYYSSNMIRKIVENTNVKTVIGGGDYTGGGYYKNDPMTKEQTYNSVMQNASRFKWITDRVYMVRGNHDDGREGGSKKITSTDLSTILTEQLDSSITKGGDLYYYVDDTAKKVRLFILDSSNTNDVGQGTLDAAQLSWLTAHVNELSTDWTIAVFLHHALNNSEKGDRTNITFYPSGTQVTNVLNSAKCHVACVFCGHQHIDVSKQMAKYPVIATTCDASYDDLYNLLWSDDVRTIGTIAEQAFDVVHVDTVNKKVYCTRFGGGQNDITKASNYDVNDRVFNYS